MSKALRRSEKWFRRGLCQARMSAFARFCHGCGTGAGVSTSKLA